MPMSIIASDKDGTMADYSSPSLAREIRPHVSFSSDVSVFEEDGNTTIDTREDDLEPKSLFSGRWIGDISTSDASRGVPLVELHENNMLKLPYQCSDQSHRKGLSLDRDVRNKKFDGRNLESPPKRIKGDCIEVSSPLSKSPATPLSADSHRSPFSSHSSPGMDDTYTQSGSCHSSFDSGPIAKRFKMHTKVINRVRAVMFFVGYATVISGACGNRLVLGFKLMGAFVLCFLACVSTTKDRQKTRLSEVVCSRKTFLLLIYIAAWTYIVNATAGVWGDNTPCIANETTARRKSSDEIVAQVAPRPETEIYVVITNLKKTANHQVKIEVIDPEITHMSESLDDEVTKGDAVEFSSAETEAQESAACEVEIEMTSPEITRVSESLDNKVTEVDGDELSYAEGTSQGTQTEVQESADLEVAIETFSPEITPSSGSPDNEVAEVDAVEIKAIEATSQDIQMEAQEAADREVEIETLRPQIIRVSASIHDELQKGEDAVGLNAAEAKSEDTWTKAQKSADRETEIEATSPEITRASGSLDVDEAEVDTIEFNTADAMSTDTQMKAQELLTSSYLEKEMSEMNTIQNEFSTTTDAEVDIITPGIALASEPQTLPLIENRHVVNGDGRYESQTANIETASPVSVEESNVMNTGTDIAEPRISPATNETETIVVEFGNGTVATGIEEDANPSYLMKESTDEEDEPSRAGLIIETETVSEPETNGGDDGNDLDTDSQKEVTNADIEDSSLDVNDRNMTENDRIDPANGEMEASREAESTFGATDNFDQLHGRRHLPRFITSFVTTSWMKDSAKRKQTSRFANYLYSVPMGQASLPNRCGDSGAVNKHVPFVALTVLTWVAKSVVRHCTTFLIGVDGKYKNQVMMDTLSEIWTSRFWI